MALAVPFQCFETVAAERGAELFRAVEGTLGELPVIAEDLGVITPAVTRLREALGLPGMVVLQFGFNPHELESAVFDSH